MHNPVFDKIKKNFGFGFMRLPTIDKEIDYDQINAMVDKFMEEGFNYFDTARMYMNARSEKTIARCLTSRYPRESYVLTDKLSDVFSTHEEIRPLFESQLEDCGVEYFDIYLMHAQDRKLFEKYKKCRAYEEALKFKEEGKIKCFGMSFHDKAEVLDRILTEYPQIEVVQIQFNYADYDDPAIEARKCYDVCRKHGKPIIVMEPVKGGSLAKLPDEAQQIIDGLGGGSAASYAIRYAAGFDGIIMVLSGMGNMEMMEDNLSHMKDYKPLNEKELDAIDKVCKVFREQTIVPCTACNYCADSCPKSIAISELFSCLNGRKLWKAWNSGYYYFIHTQNGGKASDCIGCGNCESVCPQHLPVIDLLKKVSAEFKKEE